MGETKALPSGFQAPHVRASSELGNPFIQALIARSSHEVFPEHHDDDSYEARMALLVNIHNNQQSLSWSTSGGRFGCKGKSLEALEEVGGPDPSAKVPRRLSPADQRSPSKPTKEADFTAAVHVRRRYGGQPQDSIRTA